MFQRIVSRIGASKPAETRASQGHDAVRGGAVGFADGEALEQAMFDHPGCHDLAGGIDDTADGALGSNRVPLRGAGVDAFQMMAIEPAAFLVEIPPGNAIHRCQNGGARTEQRCERARAGVGLLRLQRADHHVLRAKRRGVVARRQVDRARLSLHDQLEPVAPNRRQMRTAGNGAHFMARQCELPRHVTADRAGAEYADSSLAPLLGHPMTIRRSLPVLVSIRRFGETSSRFSR
jgi:hypothetical protein